MVLTRTPGGGEEEDVDADECDLGLGSGVVGDAWASSSNTDNGDDEFANQHSQSTPDEDCTTAILLNNVERDGSGADVDKGGDETNEEGVADRAKFLEEGGTEVENEVDTSPLLHHLKRCTEDGSAQIGRWVPKTTLEAVVPGAEVTTLWDDRHLVLVVGNDFSQFLLDVFGSLRLATKTGKDLGGLLEVALLDEVTWGFWEQQKTTTEDESPEDLDGNRDTVRSAVSSVLGSIVDARSEEDTDGDAELVSGDECSTDLLGSDLRHVQNDDGGDEANSEASDETTSDKELVGRGSSLKNDTDDEDDAAHDNSGATAREISEVASDECSKECASGENGDDQGLLP